MAGSRTSDRSAPSEAAPALAGFHPLVARWFRERYGTPSPPQVLGWPLIARGENCLITAPTGSGKTLAAFLKYLDLLWQDPDLPDSVQVVYVSPLRALGYDVERNLREPLREITTLAAREGVPLRELRVAVRTGDTPPEERRRLLRRPPHILITTPESLYLLLTSTRARTGLRTVRAVIVDELHALLEDKRGSHLSLSLERLEDLAGRPFVRVGLSATVRPLERAARFLGGQDARGRPRPVRVADAGTGKAMDLRVEVPVPDMADLPDDSIWPSIHERLLELVRSHRTTLVFVNYRGLAERLAARLNALAGEEIARTHHGSLSAAARRTVEEDLKAGRLPCLVATGTLELGIDVGAIDLVVQVESPRSVARGLQRVGRAGHVLGGSSRGRILPKFRGDLLEAAAVARRMLKGEIEEARVPENGLDVLAQQVLAMVAVEDRKAEDLLRLVRRAYPYRDLSREAFESVLRMLAGGFEGLRDLRPRIEWDGATGVLRARPGTRMLAIRSGGTIPSRGLYGLYLAGTDVKLGELDEEFAFESRPGDTFVFGTSVWRIRAITHDRIEVVPAPGAPVRRLPFWHGDAPSRTRELGREVGALAREIASSPGDPDLLVRLQEECALDGPAAQNLRAYVDDLRAHLGAVPSDRQVVVEWFRDEVGHAVVVVHSLLGRRVNAAWALAVQARLRPVVPATVEAVWGDDGFLLRFPPLEGPPPLKDVLDLDPDRVEDFVLAELGQSEILGAHFRMAAERALLLPRHGGERRTPLWLQRLKAKDLFEVARRHPEFPVLVEAYREVLTRALDLPGLREILSAVGRGAIGVHVTEARSPSPVATGLLWGLTAKFLYEDDTPRLERAATALSLDRRLLLDLVGPGRLAELLDPEAVAEVEAELRGTAHLGASGAAGPSGVALLLSYARSRGPFTALQAAEDLGLDVHRVRDLLEAAAAQGHLVRGRLVPGVHETQWCDVDVLERIRQRTLARLRRAVQPASPAAYTRFLLDWQRYRSASDPPAEGRDTLPNVLEQLQGLWLPAQLWEGEVLPARVPGYDPAWLDHLLITGAFVWVARGERVAFFPADRTAPATPPDHAPSHLSPDAERILQALRRQGASFLGSLARAAELQPPAALDALWELVQAGLVTNDTFAPVRARLVRPPKATRRADLRPTRARVRAALAAGVAGGTGRWSLLPWAHGTPGSEDEAAEAWARVLLGRYGIVSREAALTEQPGPSWPQLAAVLQKMEMAGEVHRGYFVRGLSGPQFALPRAVERLRTTATSPVQDTPPNTSTYVLLPALDPANPWGMLFPLPVRGGTAGVRPVRSPDTAMVLRDGEPVLLWQAGSRRLMPLEPLGEGDWPGALAALAKPTGRDRPRRVAIRWWGGEPVTESPAAPALEAAGFEKGYQEYVLWLTPASSGPGQPPAGRR